MLKSHRQRTVLISLVLTVACMLSGMDNHLLASGQQGEMTLKQAEINFLDQWIDSISDLWTVRNAIASQPVKTPSLPASSGRGSQVQDLSVFSDSVAMIGSGALPAWSQASESFLQHYTNDKRQEVEILMGYCMPLLSYTDSLIAVYHLPSSFRYIPLAHSAAYFKAVSEGGAAGPWQFMFTSAKRYGLQVDSYVDERRDYRISALAAMKMLTDLHEVYDDWQLTLAAYSCGPANVNKAIRRSGGARTVEGIWAFLPSPARAAIPAMTAFAILFEWHEALGLEPVRLQLPDMFDRVIIDHQLHLGQVAAVMKLPIRFLRELNPRYRYDVIPGEASPDVLLLPAGTAGEYLQLADSIAAYNDSVFFKPVTIKPAVAATNDRPSSYAGKTAISYTVKAGDNLGYIADRFDVSISQLKYWNGIRGTLIRTGQRLTIYVPESKASYYRNLAHSGSGQSSSSHSGPSSGSGGSYITYTVKSGDNPTTIAARFPGVSAEDIMKLNNIRDPRSLRVGQKLRIPR